MQGDNRFLKVHLLFEQRKYAEAEQILKNLLTEDPNNSGYLAMFAEANLLQDKLDIAYSVINGAIGLAPDAPYLYHIKARIAIERDNWDEAEKSINHSITIDPNDADYFALLAHIKLLRKQYTTALENANIALSIDAEHILALNTRSTALIKLNRSQEAFNTIQGALREDPNNAYTHANYGWSLLEKGEHKKALEHFKAALQNDPNSEYAQAGMLEALKANNWIYRVFLQYSFWIGNLTSKYQWAFVIGFYFVFKTFRAMAKTNPALIPLVVVLAVIAFSTWIIHPISNLFLRFNLYGQLLLDKKEKMSSNFVAVALLVAVFGIFFYFISSDVFFLAITIFGLAMMPPLGMIFVETKPKNALFLYTIAMALVGIAAISNIFSTGELYNPLSTIFILGFVAFQWIANFIVINNSNK